MIWKKQPFLGIWTFCLAYIVTAIWLTVMPMIGFNAADISMNWMVVWFSIGFGYMIFWDLWPISKMKQPFGGILAGIISMVVCAILWKFLFNLLGETDAYSYLIYTQFFIFLYGWYFNNWPLNKMAQPMKGIIFTVIAAIFGLIVYKLIGSFSGSYAFYLPMWLFYFFYDSPFSSETPLKKGFFWAAIILVFSYITYACLDAMGLPFKTIKGQEVFALAFICLMFFYALEGWPFSKLPQPYHGLGVCAGTIGLATAAYPIFFGILQLPDWTIASFCYTAWVFFAILVWYTSPLPVEEEVEENLVAESI